MKKRTLKAAAAAVIFSILLAACGNSSSTGTAGTPSGSAQTAAAEEAAAEAEEGGTAGAEPAFEETEAIADTADTSATAAAAAEEADIPDEETGMTSATAAAADAAQEDAEEAGEEGETTARAVLAGAVPAGTVTGTGTSSEGENEDGTEAASAASTASTAAAAASTAPASAEEEEDQDRITFDGETDLEFNARQILEADDSITREGALGIAAYLWQMGFGRMSGYPTIVEANGNRILTVFDEDGLFYNIILTPEGKIQQIEDVEGNELVTLGTKAGELVKPPISGEDVVALLKEWKSHGGHSQVLAAYNKYAGDWGRSRMDSDDQWCSETVSAAYAALGIADKIGGMASNGNTYEKNARAIGAWTNDKNYVPSTGDVLITHDDSGARHTFCVVSCDGHTIHTIAGGGSSIHTSSISVGSGRITGYVVPDW